jgi:hypothetical protein
MKELVLSFFSGINMVLALLAFYVGMRIPNQRFYKYFGFFSLFSGLYFLFMTLDSQTNFSIYALVILSAGLYYAAFPWFVLDFIGKRLMPIGT